MFENRVLRRVFELKRDEMTRECRKLHNKKLRGLYSSPSIIRIIGEDEIGGACSTNRGEEKRV
jgi:hypothetical protein